MDRRVTIRSAEWSDLAEIGRIQGRSPWRPKDYLNYKCHVATLGGRVVGFVSSRETAPDEHEILFIGVDPAHRRQGIAQKLLKDQLAASRGTWFLEVRESNIPAINLYLSMGFVATGRRPNYYSDPDETAIVMRIFS